VIKWISQDDNPNTNTTYLTLERICKAVDAASQGRFSIQPNPGGAIVPADTELEPVSSGVLQLAHNGPILWKPHLSASTIFSTSIAGPTALQYFFWYQVGDGFKLMQEMFDDGGFNVMPISASVELPETFLYTSFPINTVADLKGKKMRLLGDEAVIFGKLGVAAVATPSPEIYEAMQRGVIDGFQHQNIGGDIRMGFQEIVDYVYMSPARQPTDMYIMYVNKDAFAALPDDLKVILTEVGWAEGIKHFGLGSYELTQASPVWEAAGATIAPIPKEVEDAVVESALAFYDEQAAKDPFFKKTMESLRAWRDAYNKVLPKL